MKHTRKHPKNFAIGALSAGGKTTVGAALLERLRRDYPTAEGEPEWQIVDLGDIPRARAKRLGQSIETEAANRPGETDLDIEDAARKAFRRGNSVVLGRLPWMVASEPEFSPGSFRVWIQVAPEIRAGRRAAQRRGVYDEVLRDVCGRDDSDADRYRRLYPGVVFPPAEPFSSFDLVLPGGALSQRQIAGCIVECGRLLFTCGADSYVRVQL